MYKVEFRGAADPKNEEMLETLPKSTMFWLGIPSAIMSSMILSMISADSVMSPRLEVRNHFIETVCDMLCRCTSLVDC